MANLSNAQKRFAISEFNFMFTGFDLSFSRLIMVFPMWRVVLLLITFPVFAQPLLLDPTFPAGSGPDDYVRAIAVQEDGRILVGGNFSTFNGEPSGPLVRLLSDGSVDHTFKPSLMGNSGGKPEISSIRLASDGRIVITGIFTNVGARLSPDIAVLDSNGSSSASFNFPALAPSSSSFGTLVPSAGGGFWELGSFTNIGGINNSKLAKLKADGSVDPAFRSPFGPVSGSVNAVLPLPDGRIIITGSLTNIGGLPVPHVARLLPNGDVDRTFVTDLPDGVQLSRIVRMPDGSLIGTASSNGAQTIDGPLSLIRLFPDGKMDVSFRPGFSYPNSTIGALNRVLRLVPEPDGSLVILGTFFEIEGQERYGIARLLPDGSLAECFDPGLGISSFLIDSARQNDGRIVIGGVFRAVEGQDRPYLARLNPESDCGPGNFSFSASEFVAHEGALSALVTVVRNGSVARDEFVRVETRDGTAKSGEDYDGGVFDLAFAPGERARTVAIALHTDANTAEGDETVNLALQTLSGILVEPSAAILRIIDQTNFHASGGVDTEFRPAVAGPVAAAILTPDNRWLVGYALTNAGNSIGAYRFGLARFNLDGSLDSSFEQTNLFDMEILSLASLPDGSVLVGGNFDNVNGVARPGLVRFDASGKLDISFNPFVGYEVTNRYRLPTVNALIVHKDRSIICAGSLPAASNGLAGYRLFRISPEGTLDRAFSANQEKQSSPALAVSELNDESYAIAIEGEPATVARILGSGVRDPRFISPPYSAALGSSLFGIPGGIVAAGNGIPSINGSTPNLVRLASNGGRIARFETNASASVDLTNSAVTQLLAEADGRFLAAGDFRIGQTDVTTVLRFEADGTWDPSFDAGTGAIPRIENYSGSPYEISPKIAVLQAFPGGGWLVGGEFAGFDGLQQPFLVHLLPSRQAPAAFHFAASKWQVSESAGTFWLQVARSGDAANSGSIRVKTTAGTALPGVDFAGIDQQLTFRPGEWLKRVPITIVSNDVAQGNRAFEVALTGTDAPAVSPSSATITILDDDLNVGFTTDTFTANEGDGFAHIGIRRAGITGGAISLKLEAGSSSAAITFPASQQQFATNYVDLPISDDDEYEPDRMIALRLRVLYGDATLGPIATATLHVIENDYPESPGRGVTGIVNAVVPAPNGGVYIAGDFSAVHGIQRMNIARLLSNGEVDLAFDPETDGSVTALAVQLDGSVLIGGDFHSVNGRARAQLARLEPDGTLDPTFDPGSGPEGDNSFPAQILAILPERDGFIYAGGEFFSFNGVPNQSVVRLQTNGSMDTNFVSPLKTSVSILLTPPHPDSPSIVDEIHSGLGGRIAVVGTLYTAPFGEDANALTLSTNGTPEGTFSPPRPKVSVSTLCRLQDGDWLAGSRALDPLWLPSLPSATNWLSIRRLNPDGQSDSSFSVKGLPGMKVTSSVVDQIDVDSEGRVLFIVDIGVADNPPMRQTVLGRLMPDGSWDSSFRLLQTTNSNFIIQPPRYVPQKYPAIVQQPSAAIRGMAQQPDGTIVIGGDFTEINGELRRHLARIDPGGRLRGMLSLSIETTPLGLVQLSTPAEVEKPYVIEESEDLTSWFPVRTNATPWIPISLYGEPAASGAPRFFRAVSQE
jgi:uncharacterized delta-60 repeat protein